MAAHQAFRPWDSPGKNTGVGCYFLLQCMKVKSEREVAQSCLTLSNPMDCSLPGSSVHGIFQAKVLEWGATALCQKKFITSLATSFPVLWLDSTFSFCLHRSVVLGRRLFLCPVQDMWKIFLKLKELTTMLFLKSWGPSRLAFLFTSFKILFLPYYA